MWSHSRKAESGRRKTDRSVLSVVWRLSSVLWIAGLTAACFQPLYGERSLSGGPGLRAALAGVEVEQITAPPGTPQARLAVEVRNELTYLLTGGGPATSPTHRLNIALSVSATSLIVDPNTARPEFEIVGLAAAYKLNELASAKQVLDGNATQRVPYDIPGQQQRFAMLRAQRDAQSNAAKVVARQIHTRLVSYFAAGS